MRSIIRVIDLETGPDQIDGEPGIIEYGHVDLWASQYDMLGAPFDWQVGECPTDQVRVYVKPHAPIPPETSAIHNIIDEDVAGAANWSEIAPVVTMPSSQHQKIVALAAHNIECEKTLIGEAAGGLPWIDTFQVALHLWPEAPSHSNNALRYYLKPDGIDRSRSQPVHRALPDAYITAFTLREALKLGHSVESLIRLTERPALLARCKVGQWRNGGKGTPWEQVDSGFLRWMTGKDFDRNTMFTVWHHLDQREIDQRNEYERAELNRQYRANGMPETQSFDERSEAVQAPAVERDKNTMELPL